MNKNILAVLIVIVLVIAGIFLTKSGDNNEEAVQNNNTEQGITIKNITANQEIGSPLVIKGAISGNDWEAFEAVAGSVELIDNNHGVLASSPLNATTDWMATEVEFESVLIFQSDFSISGSLVFHNENPSGDPARDKTFTLPVKIKASNKEIDFTETGNLMINNPGFEKDVWYLSYEESGKPGLSVKLQFDQNSVRTNICSDIHSGDRVVVSGKENNGIVLVKNLKQI